MDRTTYLVLCQKCAVFPDGVGGVKKDIPLDFQVVHDGINYYPIAYQMNFDGKGNPIHIAVLHDLNANSIKTCDLMKVRKVFKSARNV